MAGNFLNQRKKIVELLEDQISRVQNVRAQINHLLENVDSNVLKGKSRKKYLGLEASQSQILKRCDEVENLSLSIIPSIANESYEISRENLKTIREIKTKSVELANLIGYQIVQSSVFKKMAFGTVKGIGHASKFLNDSASSSLRAEAARREIPVSENEEVIVSEEAESSEDIIKTIPNNNEELLKEINTYHGLLENFDLSLNNVELNKLFKPKVLVEIRETITSTCRSIIEIKNKGNHDIKPGQLLTEVMTVYFILEGFNDIINNKLSGVVNKNIRGLGSNEFIGNIFYFAILKNKFSKLVNDVFEVSIERYANAKENDSTITSITKDDVRYQLTLMLNVRFNKPIFKGERTYADKLVNPEKYEKKIA